MAISGWSTSNYIRGPNLLTAAPLTIAAWAKTSVVGTTQVVAGSFASGSSHEFRLGLNGTNNVVARTRDAGTSEAITSTTISANTWFHMCGVWAAANSRAAFLNGAGKGTETTSRTPASIARASIGMEDISTATNEWAPGGTGAIAEVGMWNVALTDDEVMSLAKGFPPSMVRPQNLVAYLPLIRDIMDLRGNSLSVIGSPTVARHCPIIIP